MFKAGGHFVPGYKKGLLLIKRFRKMMFIEKMTKKWLI